MTGNTINVVAIIGGGAFKGAAVSYGASSKVLVNSPFSLHLFIAVLSYFGLLVIAPIAGQAIHRDFQHGFAPDTFHFLPAFVRGPGAVFVPRLPIIID